jgi:hypothetical protein
MSAVPFSRRRARRIWYGLERLEARELLTAGAGDTFAIAHGTIDQPGGTATVQLTIDAAHFTLPRHSFALGVDVAPSSGSGLLPRIASVDDPSGNLIPQTFSSIYNPHLGYLAVARGEATRAVLTPVSYSLAGPSKPATYTVNLQAEGNSTGGFTVSFYLPGDANGDGVVNQADLKLTRQLNGSHLGDSKYNLSADVNRDNRIGKIDIAYVEQNMGVATNLSPAAGTP